MVTNGPSFRALSRWIFLASNPLPVPLSPSMRIVLSLAAMVGTISRICRRCGSAVTISSSPTVASTSRSRSLTMLRSRKVSTPPMTRPSSSFSRAVEIVTGTRWPVSSRIWMGQIDDRLPGLHGVAQGASLLADVGPEDVAAASPEGVLATHSRRALGGAVETRQTPLPVDRENPVGDAVDHGLESRRRDSVLRRSPASGRSVRRSRMAAPPRASKIATLPCTI